jgi:hypothetical protein
MRVAILEGWRKDNPVLAVKGVKIKSKGHRTWTDEEIAAFEAHYPIGHGASRAPRPASPIGFMTSELERDCRRD